MSAVKAERYTAYKDTCEDRLGEIPAHWKVRRVKDELESLDFKRVPLSGEVREKMSAQIYDYYGASGVIDKVENYIFDEPTILIGEDGANLLNRSTPLAFIARGKYWVNNHAHILRPTKGCLEYFCYLLESFDYTTLISGSAQPKLTAGQLNRVLLMVPPVSEQTTIAAYLDTKTAQIERQIGLLGQKAAQYGKLKQSLINETVTRGLDKSQPMKDSGVEWIGEVPEHWDIRRGKDVFEQTKNKAGLDSSSYDVLSLTLNGVIKRDLDNMKGKIPASFDGYQIAIPGDLVLCLFDIDVTPRIVGYVNNLGIITSAYTVIKGKKNIDMKYFFYYYLEQNRNGSLLANSKTLRSTMTFDLFSQLLLPVPPLEEQRAIANYLDEKTAQIDRIVTVINTQIDKLKDLRKVLINDVVTGKIKVVSEGLAV